MPCKDETLNNGQSWESIDDGLDGSNANTAQAAFMCFFAEFLRRLLNGRSSTSFLESVCRQDLCSQVPSTSAVSANCRGCTEYEGSVLGTKGLAQRRSRITVRVSCDGRGMIRI